MPYLPSSSSGPGWANNAERKLQGKMEDLELPQEIPKRKPSAKCKAIVHLAARQQLATWPDALSAITITPDQDIGGISTFQYVARRCDSTTSIDVSAIYFTWPPSGLVSETEDASSTATTDISSPTLDTEDVSSPPATETTSPPPTTCPETASFLDDEVSTDNHLSVNLWEEVFRSVNDETKTWIRQHGLSSTPNADSDDQVKALIDLLQNKCLLNNQRAPTKIRIGNQKIVFREYVADVITFLTMAGDLTATLVPRETSAPWAAGKALLKLPVQRAEQMAALAATIQWFTRIIRRETALAKLDGLSSPVTRIDEGVTKLLDAVDRDRMEKLMDFISSERFGKSHATVRETRTANTGDWLIHHEGFRDWLAIPSSSTVLCLKGTGKTYLTSRVIDHIKGNLENSAHDEGTTIILDALDESDITTYNLAEILIDLVEKAVKPVKLFISSRPDREYMDAFDTKSTIAIDSSIQRGDIDKYLQEQLYSTKLFKDRQEEIQGLIRETFASRNGGMISLNFLMQFEWEPWYVVDPSQLVPISSFGEYAAHTWPRHVQRYDKWLSSTGGIAPDAKLVMALKDFLGSPERSSEHYRAWLDKYHICTRWSYKPDLLPSNMALFTMCRYGLYNVLRDWWHRGSITEDMALSKCAGNCNALGLAALAESVPICRILLRVMDINNPLAEGHYRAMKIAIGRGNKDIISLLVSEGKVDINVDFKDSFIRYTPVQWMIMRNPDLLPWSLDHGWVDVNRQAGSCYGNALTAAVCRGNTQAVRMLLDAGADANAAVECGIYGNALVAAAARVDESQVEIMRLLVDHGADVKLPPKSGQYGSPLEALVVFSPTSEDRRENLGEALKFLLKAGADPAVTSGVGRHGSALAAAAWLGYKDSLAMMVDVVGRERAVKCLERSRHPESAPFFDEEGWEAWKQRAKKTMAYLREEVGVDDEILYKVGLWPVESEEVGIVDRFESRYHEALASVD
ncbi:hypothetical protein MKX07_005714 [Trichoderma sp. CBMAI-0711]|nr:hypothetical protein MKX07_005714 [Trichoderma sp. CBMAI-0711]